MVGEKSGPSISEGGLILPSSGLTPRDLLKIMRIAGEPESGEAILISDAIASLVAGELLELGITRPDLVPLLTGMIIRRMQNPKENITLVEMRERMLSTEEWLGKMETAFELGERGIDCASGWNGNLQKIMGEEGVIKYGASMAKSGYSTALSIAVQKPKHDSATRIRILAERILNNIGEVISVLLAIRKRQNENFGIAQGGLVLA